VKLLRVDVEMEMPPIPTWYTGRDAVVGFLARYVMHAGECLMLPTRANDQPALALYQREKDGRYHAHGIQVLTLIGRRISRITTFIDPELVPTFGHPSERAAAGGEGSPVRHMA
jgi:RNA polymerase sigma-70 factor (ECF subfamily)